jgi:uncharacterized protein YlxW (UPF0749 family)
MKKKKTCKEIGCHRQFYSNDNSEKFCFNHTRIIPFFSYLFNFLLKKLMFLEKKNSTQPIETKNSNEIKELNETKTITETKNIQNNEINELNEKKNSNNLNENNLLFEIYSILMNGIFFYFIIFYGFYIIRRAR